MRKLFIAFFILLSPLSHAQSTNHVELPVGWSLFGFNCQNSQNVVEAFSPIVDSIVIVKDYLGYVYLPEYGVNTIGDLEYGKGYQIKMTHEVEGFQFCENVCSDAEVNTDSLLQIIDSTNNVVANLQAQLSLYGCTVDSACNFNNVAEIDNGSCEYAQYGFDCYGNELTEYQVGDYVQGGIVFYINEEEGYGLVSALEDVSEGANMGTQGTPDGFEWGCYQEFVSGADGIYYDSGFQNTLDIVAYDCQTENGGITAAQATLNYEYDGYTDWFLPSKYQLEEMHFAIGGGGPLASNIGNFEIGITSSSAYWSSSEVNGSGAFAIFFNTGGVQNYFEYYSLRVRAIRAYSIQLFEGCSHPEACNYNSLVEEENGSCVYPSPGLDCNGNEQQAPIEVGSFAEGGIVFYVDETGEHGLVAALEDIAEGINIQDWGSSDGLEWGCVDVNVSGADEMNIGAGYQNTLDIVAQNCQTVNGGVSAAQATLNYESEGYSDWFPPSLNQLDEMYEVLGNNGEEFNVGGFETNDYSYYWTSTEKTSESAHSVNFSNGNSAGFGKMFSLRVRAIRAF